MTKKILDVTCGSRTIWFNKNHPAAIYCTQSHPINGGWKLCVSSGKQVRMTVKIKFCPICGRRLEGDNG